MSVTTWVQENRLLATSFAFLALYGLAGCICVGYGIYVMAALQPYDGIFQHDDEIPFANVAYASYQQGIFAVLVMAYAIFALARDYCCLSIFWLVVLWHTMLILLLAYVLVGPSWSLLVASNLHFPSQITMTALQKALDRRFFADINKMDLQTPEGGRPGGQIYPTSPVFDALQSELLCCGSNSSGDYQALHVLLPKSCCPSPDDSSGNCTADLAFQKGCKKPFKTWVAGTLLGLEAAAGFILFAVTAAAISTCVFALRHFKGRSCTCCPACGCCGPCCRPVPDN